VLAMNCIHCTSCKPPSNIMCLCTLESFLCATLLLCMSPQVESNTAHSMQRLVELDRVKTRMQLSAKALQVCNDPCVNMHV